MAQPIQMELPRRDEFDEVFQRLQLAPARHAEALLAGLEVLQALHDQGILELLRGIVRGGSKILEIVVDAAKSPDAIRGLRNVLILSEALGSIDPNQLREVFQVFPDILAVAAKSRETEPPSLLQNFRTLSGRHIRRGLAVSDGALGAWSKNAVGDTKAANAPNISGAARSGTGTL